MKKFVLDESGQGMAEYGLIISLISVVSVIVIKTIGERVASYYLGANVLIKD